MLLLAISKKIRKYNQILFYHNDLNVEIQVDINNTNFGTLILNSCTDGATED